MDNNQLLELYDKIIRGVNLQNIDGFRKQIESNDDMRNQLSEMFGVDLEPLPEPSITKVRKYKHIETGIIGTNGENDYFLHFQRCGDEVCVNESISMEFIKDSKDWLLVEEDGKTFEEQIPTEWSKKEEIETWIGEHDLGNKPKEEVNGGRARLTVIHYCGSNKKELIGQLKTLIDGLENNFDYFVG